MIILGCVLLVCASALVGLKFHLDHGTRLAREKWLLRDEFDKEKEFLRDEMREVEKQFLALGNRVISVEKRSNLLKPEPIVARGGAHDGGPSTREERRKADKPDA